jgi:hypothetical protein
MKLCLNLTFPSNMFAADSTCVNGNDIHIGSDDDDFLDKDFPSSLWLSDDDHKPVSAPAPAPVPSSVSSSADIFDFNAGSTDDETDTKPKFTHLSAAEQLEEILNNDSSDDSATPPPSPLRVPLVRGRAKGVTVHRHPDRSLVRQFPSIVSAALYLQTFAGNDNSVQMYRREISHCMKSGAMFKNFYFTPMAIPPPPPLDTSWEASSSSNESADVLPTVEPADRPIRIRTQTELFISTEHCEANRAKRQRQYKDLQYTEGVQESMFCYGHPQKSTVVFLVGCACSKKQPHCLQCLTTLCDKYNKTNCLHCNTKYTGLTMLNTL